MSKYIDRVLEETRKKNAGEPEFLQTVEEVLTSLAPVIDAHPEYEKASLLERMVEPERTIEFRVTWLDDSGHYQVNRGYRVQYNGALGPYKGGLRFHPSVNLSIIKFLGFEQTFKDALTGLPIGGGKGGSDFDPRGKSDGEVMRFCQAYMTELYRHIGQDIDCPAGDLGCGNREINYMYGQYRRLVGASEFGALSGKSVGNGGSLMRAEATGFGAVYYLCEVLKDAGESIEGKRIAISGFGNVCWGVTRKVAELGGKVVTLSGPDGYIYDPDGITTQEKIDYMVEMRNSGRDKVQDYADRFGCEFHAGEKPWGLGADKVDIMMPCATQNDVKIESAKKMAANGIRFYIEVANMPTTNDALEFLKKQENMIVAPSKAVNACGVAVSALEMSQNAERLYWTAEEVDAKMHQIMSGIYHASKEAAARYGLGYDLVAGANIVGFQRVADAMMAQGIF